MNEEACLVTNGSRSSDDVRVARLLSFFGVACRTGEPGHIASTLAAAAPAAKMRVLASAGAFGDLVEELQRSPAALERWSEQVHSVFIYAGDERPAIERAIRALGEDATYPLQEDAGIGDWVISHDEFCGVLGGLSISPSPSSRSPSYVFDIARHPTAGLITRDGAAVMLQTQWKGVPVFVSLATDVIDLDAELTTPNFDLRDYFFEAAPISMYARSAFPKSAWHAGEAGACLIIDDPLLRPRYGFIRFQELLGLMERHDFSTSIAFIPWNWQRNDPKTIRLFAESAERYSLCIHGCDHTAAEFGTTEPDRLRALIASASKRMAQHQQASGLPHDEIMVFPQGVFSEQAIVELKRANFTAVVNTEVHCTPPAKPITVGDVWNTALTTYADFPLYTRRYPKQGVENQAFDLLLGKPCFIVIHHDFCSDGCKQLVDFVQRLNALKIDLAWRSPGEVVRRSYRQRELGDKVTEIEMFATELFVQNRTEHARQFRIKRREADAPAIEQAFAGAESINFEYTAGFVHYVLSLEPGESRTIRVRFRTAATESAATDEPGSALKTRVRRYLCEARDNYLVPAKSRLRARAA